MSPEGETGKRIADKLVKVHARSGDDRYLHTELALLGTDSDIVIAAKVGKSRDAVRVQRLR